jgi:hypothetical protein
VSPITEIDLQAKVKTARESLDAWVREMMEWHYNPETGCPFWLEYSSKLGWDPRREIRGYGDLGRLGAFEDEWLRGGPVSRWVPRGCAGKPIYVFETGGNDGAPKSRISSEDFRVDYEAFSATLPGEAFPPGADWIAIGPTGPRRLRLAVEHLAQHRGGICFMVDMDPGWVTRLIEMGQMEMVDRYKQHVIDQALTLLRAHENIHCLFTTPKLLEALCEKVSLKRLGIRGVFCEGSGMTPQFCKVAVEELLDGVYFAPAYGNALTGLAVHKPLRKEDNYALIYYPPSPRAMIDVVDAVEHGRVVEYGQSGRVRLTTLTREFLMPHFLEREEAEREPPCELYPWDGARNIRPI